MALHSRTVAAIVLASLLAGCFHTRPMSHQQLREEGAAQLRLTLTDDRQIAILNVRLVEDTLVGELATGRTKGQTVRIPQNEVELIETYHTDIGRTVVVVAGVTVTAVAALVAYAIYILHNIDAL